MTENRIRDIAWVALDDDAGGYYTGWPKVVLCDSKVGLTEERLSAVAKALVEQARAAEDLAMTDSALYRRLRERVTELRMSGWM